MYLKLRAIFNSSLFQIYLKILNKIGNVFDLISFVYRTYLDNYINQYLRIVLIIVILKWFQMCVCKIKILLNTFLKDNNT